MALVPAGDAERVADPERCVRIEGATLPELAPLQLIPWVEHHLTALSGATAPVE